MALKTQLKTAPTVEPITLTEAKSHLRVDGDTEDAHISSLVTTARVYCEKYSNRAFITQTWEMWLNSFPTGNYIQLPRPPLQSVTSIKYYDSADVEATMGSADYFVDKVSEPGGISLSYGKSWPSVTLRPVNAVCIEYVAGYGLAVAVPQDIKQAMLMLISYWDHNREALESGTVSKEIDFSVKALLGMDRVIPI